MPRTATRGFLQFLQKAPEYVPVVVFQCRERLQEDFYQIAPLFQWLRHAQVSMPRTATRGFLREKLRLCSAWRLWLVSMPRTATRGFLPGGGSARTRGLTPSCFNAANGYKRISTRRQSSVVSSQTVPSKDDVSVMGCSARRFPRGRETGSDPTVSTS